LARETEVFGENLPLIRLLSADQICQSGLQAELTLNNNNNNTVPFFIYLLDYQTAQRPVVKQARAKRETQTKDIKDNTSF
jgi:hypothetical protein